MESLPIKESAELGIANNSSHDQNNHTQRRSGPQQEKSYAMEGESFNNQ